jgi:hypothetical protein
VLSALPAGVVERIVICDNGSTDRSALPRERGPRERTPRRGRLRAAAGLRQRLPPGLAHLRATGAPEIVVFLDGDYSDHPEELPLLVAPIAEGRADFVIGSRKLGVAEPGAMLPQARFGNALAVFLIRVLTGFRYTDLGPFRAIRWDALESLSMEDRDYGWTCEMQMKAIGAGLRIVEVPVSYRKRVGVSKITGTLAGTLGAGVKILTWVFRHARARRGEFYPMV